MLKSLLGVAVLLAGFALLIGQRWVTGLLLVVLGVGLLNGARLDTWISFDFGESGGSLDGSWGC